jgi:tight adherence protein C
VRPVAATLGWVLAGIGGFTRRLAGRAPDPVADRRWGAVAVGAAVWFAAGPIPVVVVAVVGGVQWWHRSRTSRQARADLAGGLPDAVDLLVLGADAGLTVFDALEALARHGIGPVAEAAATVVERARRGVRLGDALEGLRTETVLAPLADALIDAERYGTPLSAALGQLATDAREHRRRSAEVVARRLPVRLLAPLVGCALPATLLLAVVPVVVVSLDGLGW